MKQMAVHWRSTIAYMIIAIAIVVVVVRQNNQQAAQDAEAKARQDFQQAQIDENARQLDQICESDAQTRQATIDVVNTLGADQPINPTDPPDAQRRVAAANAARAGARAMVAQFLDPPTCADGKKPPSHTTTTTIP